jgi:hypothetical protein
LGRDFRCHRGDNLVRVYCEVKIEAGLPEHTPETPSLLVRLVADDDAPSCNLGSGPRVELLQVYNATSHAANV